MKLIAINQKSEKGIALITVLVIASVLVIFATFILNARQVNERRTFNIINGARAQQYMAGVEIFGQSILQSYFTESKAERVVRNQPWATTPMVFPIEQDRGKLTGEIRDMHNCFNLNSIIGNDKGATARGPEQGNGGAKEVGDESSNVDTEIRPVAGGESVGNERDTKVDVKFGEQTTGEKIFVKIIEPLLPETDVSAQVLASTLRDWIDADQEPSGADGAEDYHYTGLEIPYRTADTLLAHSSELMVIKGFDAKIYDSIKDYICVLPTKKGTINVNTVKPEHAELVWALLEDADLSAIREALQDLPEEGYDQESFFAAIGEGKVSKNAAGRLVFDSKYFLMTATAEIQTGRAEVKSLLEKNDTEFKVIARHIGE